MKSEALNDYQERIKEAEQLAYDYLININANVKLLNDIETMIADDVAYFCKPSGVEPLGLTNDLATQPIPVLTCDLQNKTFKFVNDGEKYFYS